jgi:hypothetical protein
MFADARLHLDKSGALRSTTQLHLAAWAAVGVVFGRAEIVGATPKEYTIWLFNICHGKSPFIIGKPSINRPVSMAMLNN